MSTFSTITARDNGRLPFLLRLVSVVFCVGSLISGYFSIGSTNYQDSTPLIVIASSIILGWDIIYLIILLIICISIPLPITITFDLVSWLLALLWGTFFSIYNVPRMGRYLSAGFDGCNPSRPGTCETDKRVMKAMFATCVLLWTLTVIHFALFLRASMTLLYRRWAAAHGISPGNASVPERNCAAEEA